MLAQWALVVVVVVVAVVVSGHWALGKHCVRPNRPDWGPKTGPSLEGPKNGHPLRQASQLWELLGAQCELPGQLLLNLVSIRVTASPPPTIYLILAAAYSIPLQILTWKLTSSPPFDH